MIFERPAFLFLLAVLIPLWLFLRHRSTRPSLLLKTAIFTAAVVALAGPSAVLNGERIAVTVVADNSASMPREGRVAAGQVLRSLVRKDSGAELRLVTFAARPQVQRIEREGNIPSDASDAMATDIESALRLALANFPERGARRILLASDGNETRGRALTAALRARERGVPIYTLAPPRSTGGAASFRVDSLALPQQVYSGERFAVSLKLESSRAGNATISLICQGRQIGAAPVSLEAGENQVDMEAQITGAGVSLIEGRIAVTGGDGSAATGAERSGAAERTLFSQAVTVRRPRVLYIYGGGPPPVAGSGGAAYLADTLRRAQMEVQAVNQLPSDLRPERYEVVVMDNFPDQRLSAAENDALDSYVLSGGGLVFIAGANNARIPEEPREPFEKLLPVRGDPQPAPEEMTAVVLVLDKSASMDGLKIAMAREAGRASLITLRPTDKFGVLAFDSSHRWVAPIAPASDIARITSLISSISADGGTSIYPALATAHQAIRSENAARKHIILLTDGWSTPGEFVKLAQEAAAERITISTVGVGKEVNRSLLENVAREARGKSYFVENPETVPQILSGEVRELAASPVRERPFRASVVRPVELTDGVDFARSPRLLGFVKTKARPGSETVLRTDSGEPLLVRWQHGLGRVIAFLSDAKNRWGADWLTWNAYGTFWPQTVRDACRGSRTVRAGVRPGASDGEAIVYYDMAMEGAGGRARVPERPRVIVAAAGEQPRSIALEETSPGHFEARIPAAERGLYRIVTGSAELSLPEAGFYRGTEELREREANLPFLREISQVSGGEFGPTVEQLLDPAGSVVGTRQALWPYFLILALLLNFLELALRRGALRIANFELRIANWKATATATAPIRNSQFEIRNSQ